MSSTTKIVSLNPFMERYTRYNINVIKFVSDLRQVDGFPHVLWLPPPIKLTATYNQTKNIFSLSGIIKLVSNWIQ